MRKHIIWSFDKIFLQNVLNNSSSYVELFKKLNLNMSKSLIKMLRYRTKIEGISYEKFTDNARKLAISGTLKKFAFKEKLLNEILVENSTYIPNVHLKNRLIKLGILKYECYECGINEWQNKPLTLQLDHVNGKNNDNRIENFRLLCPNCHSQTPTFAGKKNKIKKNRKLKYCGKCGNTVNNKVFCEKCDDEMKLKRRKVNRPSYEILMIDINNMGYSATGRKYGVSDVTIKKWQKKYEKIIN
jgi:Zn finger protein HypA/HybF involved in hydrogenase expression